MSKRSEPVRSEPADGTPDRQVSARELFGIPSDMQVPAFSKANEHVPDLDEAYRFDHDTTLAILAGFKHNRKVAKKVQHKRK